MPLATKSKIDPKKAEADRLQAFLHDMLREEENKYCADCEAKQPRWASWNLGVFLCIRCAGLHRNLGVHISKIKSVNLDSWTAEQVQSVRVMGNAKAKAVYEAELPTLFRRPQSDQALEGFIRAKYEQKRYLLRDWRPPRVDVGDLPASAVAERRTGAAHGKISHPLPLSPKREPAGGHGQQGVLVDLFSSPEHSATQPAPVNSTVGNNNPSNLLSSSLDDFGPIVSAPTAGGQSEGGMKASVSYTPGLTSTTASDGGSTGLDGVDLFGFGAAAPAQPKGNTIEGVDFGKQQDTKKTTSDIMALFSTAPAPLQQAAQPQPFPADLGNFQHLPAFSATQHSMPTPAATAPAMNFPNHTHQPAIPTFANFGAPPAMSSPPYQQQPQQSSFSFFPAATPAPAPPAAKPTQVMSGLDDLLADFKM